MKYPALHKISRYTALLLIFKLVSLAAISQNKVSVSSPDRSLVVQCSISREGKVYYTIHHNGSAVLQSSRLGIVRKDDDFSAGLSFISASAVQVVKDNYTTLNAKKSNISYVANKRVIRLNNAGGKKMNIIFQVSNGGVAFRYEFPEVSNDVKVITEELTTYGFDKDTKAWLQPMSVAKSGWEQSNPSYEEQYKQDIAAGTLQKRDGYILHCLEPAITGY